MRSSAVLIKYHAAANVKNAHTSYLGSTMKSRQAMCPECRSRAATRSQSRSFASRIASAVGNRFPVSGSRSPIFSGAPMPKCDPPAYFPVAAQTLLG